MAVKRSIQFPPFQDPDPTLQRVITAKGTVKYI